MLKEFREFAVKGNVVDMAVGIIIGGAFGTVVKSLVSDVIMPPIGLVLGGIDFSNLHLVLHEGDKASAPYATLKAAQEAGAVTLNYGLLLNNVISFVIVAFAAFMLVKAMNQLKREAPAADPTTKTCPECATEIPIKAKRCPSCTSTLPA